MSETALSQGSALPSLTVVIPTHNRRGLLQRAVTTVLEQTHPDFDLLIVDDHSTDGTAQYLMTLQEKRIRSVKNQRTKGVAGARNTGLNEAKGDLIVFLDDDDEMLPDCLSRIVVHWATHGQHALFGWCGVERVHYSGDLACRRDCATWTPRYGSLSEAYESMVAHREIGTSAGLTLRREAIGKVGFFDERMEKAEDTDYLCRLAAIGECLPIPEVLLRLHIHSGSRLTAYDSRMADAYATLVAKHAPNVTRGSKAWLALHYKAGWLQRRVRRRKAAAWYLWQVLVAKPSHLKAWIALGSIMLPTNVVSRLHVIVSDLLRRVRQQVRVRRGGHNVGSPHLVRESTAKLPS